MVKKKKTTIEQKQNLAILFTNKNKIPRASYLYHSKLTHLT